MTRRQAGVDRALYLMHFDHNDGHVFHYAGVTHVAGLRKTLRLHRTGTCYPRTLRARTMGFVCTAVQHEVNADPWREKVMKTETVAHSVCELCAIRRRFPRQKHDPVEPLQAISLKDLRDMNFVPRWDRWK